MMDLIRMFFAAQLLRIVSALVPETADAAPANAHLRRAGQELMRIAMGED